MLHSLFGETGGDRARARAGEMKHGDDGETGLGLSRLEVGHNSAVSEPSESSAAERAKAKEVDV